MSTPVFDSATPVTLNVNVPLQNGVLITPTSVSVKVLNDNEETVFTSALPLPSVGATSISITLSSSNNIVPDGTPFSLRTVQTKFVTASGEYTDRQAYIVKSLNPLIRLNNSFITLNETVSTRYTLNTLDGWDAASEDQRIAALISAYKNMVQLRYRYPLGSQSQSRIVDFFGTFVDSFSGRAYAVLADITSYTPSDYNSWPTAFKEALKRAQMVEANSILKGDPVTAKRLQGIVAEGIGESNMRFRDVPEIQTPVSKEALQHLRGFINSSIMVGRG